MTSLRNLTGNFVSTETVRKICILRNILIKLLSLDSVLFIGKGMHTAHTHASEAPCALLRQLKYVGDGLQCLYLRSVVSQQCLHINYITLTKFYGARCGVCRFMLCTCPCNRCNTTDDRRCI